MADIVRPQIGQIPSSMQTRYVDMGDGTHAIRVYIAEINVSSLRTIDSAHVEVHEGHTFRAWMVNTALANNATLDIKLTTGAKYIHFSSRVGAGGDGLFLVYKSPATSGGTPFTPVNLNGSSSIVAVTTVLTGVTVSNTGDLIDYEVIPGGSGGNAPGGAIRSDTEDIFNINTSYLVRVQNIAGNAQPFGVELQWYEED